MNKLTLILLFTMAAQAQAAGHHSTITFGESAKLTSTPAKKRSFKQDVEAVGKAHDSWRKAHLSTTLYACQRNSESLALLARKVSDRLDTANKAALKEAKGVEKAVEGAVGADTVEMPDTLSADQVATLQAKANQLANARKQAALLERLSGQVMKFYENDMPKESAVDGNCVGEYSVAMKKGVAASEQYHSDVAALSQKLDKLTKLAQVAMRKASANALVAGR